MDLVTSALTPIDLIIVGIGTLAIGLGYWFASNHAVHSRKEEPPIKRKDLRREQ